MIEPVYASLSYTPSSHDVVECLSCGALVVCTETDQHTDQHEDVEARLRALEQLAGFGL